MIGTKRPRTVRITFDNTEYRADSIEEIRLHLVDYDGRLINDSTRENSGKVEVYAEMKKDLELSKFREDFKKHFPESLGQIDITEVDFAA
ncbi:MAG: hypothetical protein AABW91_04490 [Nanoarchaeota archaeon]